MDNWFTILAAAIVIGSAVYGFARGFGRELRHLSSQLIHMIVIGIAIWIAWIASQHALDTVHHLTPNSLPLWLTRILSAWQKSPRIGNLIVFFVIYLILSNIMYGIIRPMYAMIPVKMPTIPNVFSRFMGSVMGALVGVLRVAVLGAIAFIATEYLAVPFLQHATAKSQPYQILRTHIYQRWLQPLVVRELPVLAQGALQPIAQNIALFAVPTSVDGSETGVLVIPKPVAEKAHQITKGISSPEAKAYALYEWEIHNITYNWKKYDDYVDHGRWDAQTPLQTLETKKGVCADFALLYADFAHASGLTVRIDEGLAGTASSYGSHAWNEVYLPQQHKWILVDTTWGSEQDAWFNVPAQQFDQTHETQRVITIYAQ
ncbi:transglutaminase domain-containing protein [Alicyclobacillus acidiphilus]|uniref:transglutaminase domain-containing protein n=1 Tax=Alicyclobacillus acidiphilus TaxID=182455 RepID=UPI00082A0F55|nr:transglutaminase domain-containing protein [Alicyclobacillus acidiphilus]